MDKLNRLLSQIDQMISQQAIGHLTNPKTKDSFGFGEAVGTLKGLNLAKEQISIILNEDDDEKPYLRES